MNNQQRIDLITTRLNPLQPIKLEIEDQSHLHAGHPGAKESGGGHFAVTIVAEAFGNKSLIQRHKMIYQQLSGLIPNEIHAVSIVAKTPTEAAAQTSTEKIILDNDEETRNNN